MSNNTNIDYTRKVLSVKNLRKYFSVGTGKRKILVPAIDNISFDIYKGEIFGLVGESGCGKTTTGRTIIKLYDPTDGTIEFLTDDSKEPAVIGAGYSGNLHRIKKAREKFDNETIEFRPYFKAVYHLRSDYKKKKDKLKKQLTESQNQKNEIVAQNLAPYDAYKESTYQLKQAYILEFDTVKFNNYSKISGLKKIDSDGDIEVLKYQKKLVKKNFNQKKTGMKESAGLSGEERQMQLAAIVKEYESKVAVLDAKILEFKKNASKKSNTANNKEEIKKLNKANKTQLQEITQKYVDGIKKIETDFYNQTHNKQGGYSVFKKLANRYFGYFMYRFKKDKEKNVAIENALGIRFKLLGLYFSNFFKKIGLFFSRFIFWNRYKNDKNAIKPYLEAFNLTFNAEKEAIQNIKKMNNGSEVSKKMTKIQMIFQDPIESLNPRMTVRDIIAEGLIIQGVKDRKYIDKRVIEVLELVGLSAQFASRYPHEFSGGQRQRIGVARDLIIEPELIIADEPISALDVSIQAQIINLLYDLKAKLGFTILFIAHDLSVVKYFCDRTAVMYAGKIVETADSEELFNNPVHPYTKSLLSAIPQPDPNSEKSRKRITYNPKIHDYSVNKGSLKEILPKHFVYANDAEFNQYKNDLGK